MIQAWIYKIILHKYTPIRWISELWVKAEGYRTIIASVLWMGIYEMGRLHLWIFADPAVTQKMLEGLAVVGSATLLDKFKRNLGYADMTADELKTMFEEAKKQKEPK